MRKYRSIVILTGAGISAESGLATFRGPDGLWEGHRVEDVATPEAYARDPLLVQQFYNARRAKLQEVEPNAAHKALVRLEQMSAGEVLIVTQNVDDLHGRAGSQNLIHMHGELRRSRCTACNHIELCLTDLQLNSRCGHCTSVGTVRPHIVWFGEMPLEMERIETALADCDLFMAIGTSANVYPAAGFVNMVRHIGRADRVEINLERTTASPLFNNGRYGRATEMLPPFVDEILNT